MPAAHPPPDRARFGDFELDFGTGELRRNGVRIPLPEQPLRLLEALVERPGLVVTRDQLRERLWASDTFVDFEHGLNAAVKRLRDVLGDAAEQPRFVETVPKRGYRFVAPIVSVERTTPLTSRSPIATLVFAIATVLLAVAAAAAVWFAWRGASRAPASQPVSVRRLTFDSGLQTDPVFSPDGRFIAYTSNRSGNFDIWMQPADGGPATQLTTDPFDDLQPTWAPDGATIFFRSEREGGGIFALSVADRHSRRVLGGGGYGPQLSPDGQWLLYKPTRITNAYSIAKADGSGSVAFPIPGPGWHADVERAAGWHPSGRAVFLYGFGPYFGAQIYAPLSPRPVDSEIASDVRERLVRLGLAVVDNQRIAWSADGRTLYFSGKDVTEDIWSLTVDPQSLRIIGGPARVTTGPELDRMPSVSRTTGALVFGHLSGLLRVRLFELDATGRTFTGRHDEVTPPDADTWLAALSADGEKLAIVVENAGGHTTEVQEITLGSMTRRTLRVADAQKGEVIFGPRWSRDGRRIAYSFRTFMPPPFQSSIRLLDVGTGEESLLTTHASASADNPWDWSRDGTAILASGARYVDGKFALVRLPLSAAPAAERARVVLAQSASDMLSQAQESPDRRWVAYNAVPSNHEHSTLYVVAASGNLTPTALTPRTGWYDKPRWSADGRILYFLAVIDGLVNAWGLPFDPAAGRAAGPPFQLTDYRGPGDRLAGIKEIGETEISVSGRRVALSTTRVSGAIWSASPASSP